MNTLPAEFVFDRGLWYRLLASLCGLMFISGLLAGVIGGHSWSSTARFAIALPVIFTPLFWLIGCRSLHRSYVITQDGINLRHRGRDIEQILWPDIAEIRPWPLAIITRTGRKIPFHLMGADMLLARDTLLHVFPDASSTSTVISTRPTTASAVEITPGGLLIACFIAVLVAAHGWATVHFGWSRTWALPGFAAGCIAYPTMAYIAIRLISERGVSFRLLLCAALSLTTLTLWVLTLWRVSHS